MKKKKEKTPGAVLKSLMEEYQLTVFNLSRDIRIGYPTIFKLLGDETKVTCKIAFCLAKYFNTTPEYWLKLQLAADVNRLKKDKEFVSFIKTIGRARKIAD